MKNWVLWLANFLIVIPLWAQERPLQTESAAVLAVGSVRADFGVEFLHRQRYSLSGLEGDLMRLGVGMLRVGVGEYAEIQVSGAIRDFLTVARRSPAVIAPTFAGDTTSDFGNLTLGTKLRLVGEKDSRPAVAFKFAVQLPNTTNESGLGKDVTDFNALMLLEKRAGRGQLLGSIGLAILSSAVQPNSQSDMLTYGLGGVFPVRKDLDLVAEVNGRQGPDRLGNEKLTAVRVGARIRAAGLNWDVAGIAGLRRFDPEFGLTVGVTYEFQAFHKKSSPVTIRQAVPPVRR